MKPTIAGAARFAVLATALSVTISAHAFDPASIAGVYKHRFTNGTVGGERFEVEDVLEIVEISPTSAYVKARLNFYNGHMCGFAVVADVENEALVYRSHAGDPAYPIRPCRLTVMVTPKQLILGDADQICRQTSCGTRGGYNGFAIDRKTRRPIRYGQLLLDSEDYRSAIAEHARP